MSVWILKSSLTSTEEDQLEKNNRLILPFHGLPDLSNVLNEQAMGRLLTKLRPDAAPETIIRQAEMHWKNLHGLAVGDLVVVPLTYCKQFALGEISTRYRFEDEDHHITEVKWLETHIAPKKLMALKKLMENPAILQPVVHHEQRKQVYRFLKRGYNRFAKWQWIIVVLFTLQVISMVMQRR